MPRSAPRTPPDAAPPPPAGEAVELAARVHRALAGAGATLAAAESLTGGMVSAALTAVPGASATFRGAVVAYATELKHTVLGVDAELLARSGAVHPDVAAGMAAGARRVAGADWAVAVTGVAGPEPQDGQPVGTVFAAVAGPGGRTRTRRLALSGSREDIRGATARAALSLVLEQVTSGPGAGTSTGTRKD